MAIIGLLPTHFVLAATGCCQISTPSNSNGYFETITREECRQKNLTYAGANFKFEENKKAAANAKGCEDINTTSSNNTKAELKPSKIIAPTLQVSIPGFGKFSDVTCDNPDVPCSVPWLAEYIQALYNYSLIIISLLAVIVLMIGGVVWLTAGGNRSQIEQAQNWIKGGITGVILALCSYMILFIVNPNLTILQSINIGYIKNVDLDSLSEEEYKENIANQPNNPPYGSIPKDPVSFNTETDFDVSFVNPYSYIRINTAYADNFFDPPSGVPIILQGATEVAHIDYSISCNEKCLEKYNTKNNSCEAVTNSNGTTQGFSTIGSSGCGIAALNMVMAAYGAIGANPNNLETMARFMEKTVPEYRECGGGTHEPGLTAYAQSKGLISELVNASRAEELVAAGYPVMLSIDASFGTKTAKCTGGAHWIVIRKKTNNKYLVNNPETSHKNCQVSINSIQGANRYLFVHPRGEPRLDDAGGNDCIADWQWNCNKNTNCCSGLKCVKHDNNQKRCQSCIPIWEWKASGLSCCRDLHYVYDNNARNDRCEP